MQADKGQVNRQRFKHSQRDTKTKQEKKRNTETWRQRISKQVER